MLTPFDFTSADYLPPGSMGPGPVAVLDLAILFLGLGATIVFMFLRARELSQAQAREDADLHDRAARPLTRGPARVVRGRVEPSDAGDVPVEIDIEQEVQNHASKNSHWHTWNEVSRTVRAVPFYVARDEGEPVYVEVDPHVRVVDLLGTRYPNDRPGRRIRAAEVRRGEEVLVYGDLVEGFHPRAQSTYRGGTGWILRTPKTGPMIVAAEGLRQRYAGRISFLRGTAAMMGVAFVIAHAFSTLPFVAASFFGTHTTAQATAYTYVTYGKNHAATTHYAIKAVADDGFTLRQDVPHPLDGEFAFASRDHRTVTVPMVRTGDVMAASYIGDVAYLPGPLLVIESIVSAAVLLLVCVKYRETFAWYDRKTVKEPGGTGRWIETRPAVPIEPSAQ